MASSAAISAEPITKVVEIRGQRYTLQELTIGEYTELEKKATIKRPNPVNEDGPPIEVVDQTLLLKFMVLKCVITPKMTPAKQSELPMKVALGLNKTVNQMHFPESEEDREDVVEIDDDEEGEG
jgi:hypothetical protein